MSNNHQTYEEQMTERCEKICNKYQAIGYQTERRDSLLVQIAIMLGVVADILQESISDV